MGIRHRNCELEYLEPISVGCGAWLCDLCLHRLEAGAYPNPHEPEPKSRCHGASFIWPLYTKGFRDSRKFLCSAVQDFPRKRLME